MRTNETTVESLRYRFTPDEHLTNCEDLASKLDYKAELSETHKAIKADLKEQETRVEAELGKLTRLVRDKFEIRNVQCRWDYGRPSTSQKTLVRLDSGDDVRTEMMLDHERQQMLKLEMPSHVLSGPGSLQGKRVLDLADTDIEYYASRDVEELLQFNWIREDADAIFTEAKRRADEKAGAASNVVTMPSTAAVAAESSTVSDSAMQFVAEAQAQAQEQSTDAQEGAQDPGCERCGNPSPLANNGRAHVDGSSCSPAAAILGEEPVEPGHTLPSARAVDGVRATRRRATPVKPPTAEEREALEAIQQQEAAELSQIDPQEEAPEL
jgi:hypothetical protein